MTVVAPRVGVWIETSSPMLVRVSCGVSLARGRGLKHGIVPLEPVRVVAPRSGAWIETPACPPTRGCERGLELVEVSQVGPSCRRPSCGGFSGSGASLRHLLTLVFDSPEQFFIGRFEMSWSTR